MADQIPIYAVTKGNGEFIYTQEFQVSDGFNANKVSYEQTDGTVSLVENNLSDNLDIIESTINGWTEAVPEIVHFTAKSSTSFDMFPRSTYLDVPFDIIEQDSHNGWNVANQEYIIPSDGVYEISSTLTVDTTYPDYLTYFNNGAGEVVQYMTVLRVFDGSEELFEGEREVVYIQSNTTGDKLAQGRSSYIMLKLTEGATISVQVYRYYMTTSGIAYPDVSHPLDADPDLNVLTIRSIYTGYIEDVPV